jgi:CBS domain containing-hemolysin-like protein
MSESEWVKNLPWDEYLTFSLVSFGLVCFAGLMSGLTVGLMSISSLDLKIKLESGTSIEKKYARRVSSILHDHHLLLVTLLVANAAAMESLPLFLDEMFNEIITIILSVSFVLIFGEVLPQAFCTGPDQLKIAYYMTPLVRIIVVIFFPISYPISKILNWCFGKHRSYKLKNDDIKALVALHTNMYGSRHNLGLMKVQVKMIHGAIDLRYKLVKDHIIPLDKVYGVSTDAIINKKTFRKLVKQGYSRVPVYQGSNRNAIVGILLTKKLLVAEEGLPISEIVVNLREPMFVSPDLLMIQLLEKFKEGKSHLAIARDDSGSVLGIITLEDVLEEVMKFEIYDEGDYDEQAKLNTTSLIPPSKEKPPEPRRRTIAGSIDENLLPP